MSEMAKSAREAMRAKAQRMGSDRPLEKVDSSSWTPPDMLNADVQTGMRPLKRRNFKSGGKVAGDAAKHRADRKARKSGGGASGEQPLVDRFINRDLTKANEYREGKKHIGGLKAGGRAKKNGGGSSFDDNPIFKSKSPAIQRALDSIKEQFSPAGMRKMMRDTEEKRLANPEYRAYLERKGLPLTNKWDDESRSLNEIYTGKKPSSRAEKCSGGSMKRSKHATKGSVPETSPDHPMNKDYSTRSLRDNSGREVTSEELINKAAPTPPSRPVPTPPERPSDLKKGGRAKKFMGGPMMQPGGLASVGAGALSGGAGAGSGLGSSGAMTNPNPFMPDPRLGIVSKDALSFGAGARGSPYKKGGKVSHGDEAADKALIRKMVKAEARTGRAAGGRAPKGKTDIKIYVAGGQKQPAMPPQGGVVPAPSPIGGSPAGRPVPVTQPAAGGAPPQMMPMPIPMPMGGGQAPAPAPRKHGGRLTKVAHSYKDMEAGAGSGEGRLQKTDIAKRSNHKEGGKVGHWSYKSYKDMDAGAGSGFGRLEKAEIARRS